MFGDVKTVFFDMGYTLVDEDRVWQARCREQAAMEDAKKRRIKHVAIYTELVKASVAYLSPWRTAIARFGFSQSAPYRPELEVLYPEAKDVLAALSEKYTLGVIANQEEGLEKRLADFGIDKYLSVVVSSFEVKRIKPDPRIFEYALEKAGCAAENTVMIGDRLDNDIFPAKRLGMGTIWIRQGFGGMQTPLDERYVPDARVETLGDILNLL